MTPAGHGFVASLAAGTTADFVVGVVTAHCKESASGGRVPDQPYNQNPAGPVATTLSPPTYTSDGGGCTTSLPLTKAVSQANTDNGPWRVALQYDQAGTVATFTIPQAGMITTTSGLASCRVTVAPDGPASVVGRFVGATSSNRPRLEFSGENSVPIRITGGFPCPTSVKKATFRVTYEITNTTDPAQTITVGP
ncbi:hypothetical protein BE21_04085 [Sorangium cellulosum]|uniref:Uncharacterized protein n=1 Tax=Sorangium cellulosum TaxID=56 RepID=A0A150THI9_SORCE|nr:hypothetical protein BE21_04085 [Sorangium cellulosum]